MKSFGFVGKFSQRLFAYYKVIATDYITVAKETVGTCKDHPFRTVLYLSSLGGLVYAYKTNPSEDEMRNELTERRQLMALVPNTLHNTNSDADLADRSILLCQNRLHYYNLWFISLLVRTPHDNSVRIFYSQDKNLKSWPWIDFYNSIFDIGFLGRWYKFNRNFTDYDINSSDIANLPA